MSKRGKQKIGPKYNILNKKYAAKIIEELNLDINVDSVIKIIHESNLTIKDIVLNNTDGFKLSSELGYLITTAKDKQETKKRINYKATKLAGTVIYHNNFHNNNATVIWENYTITNSSAIENYKLVIDRDFQKKKSQLLLAGKQYNFIPKGYFKTFFKFKYNGRRN